jgi:glutamate racemase
VIILACAHFIFRPSAPEDIQTYAPKHFNLIAMARSAAAAAAAAAARTLKYKCQVARKLSLSGQISPAAGIVIQHSSW